MMEILLSYMQDTKKLEAEVLLLLQFACACLEFSSIYMDVQIHPFLWTQKWVLKMSLSLNLPFNCAVNAVETKVLPREW